VWYLCVCSMGVTAEMLRPFLEGWTLKQIIDAKRLFLVDMKILHKIPTKDNRPVRRTFEFCHFRHQRQLIHCFVEQLAFVARLRCRNPLESNGRHCHALLVGDIVLAGCVP